MREKILIITLAFLSLALLATAGVANDEVPNCRRAEAKVVGDMARYSLHAEANGPVFFTGIRCAIKFRNKELCAMEMLSFDTTAKVFDYQNGREIEIGKAYFWLDDTNSDAPILAFATKESAELYSTETKPGVILDYTSLTEKLLK